MVGPGVVDGDVAVLVGHVGAQGREDLKEAGNAIAKVQLNLIWFHQLKLDPQVAALISNGSVKTECDLVHCKNIAVIVRDNLFLSSARFCNSIKENGTLCLTLAEYNMFLLLTVGFHQHDLPIKIC